MCILCYYIFKWLDVQVFLLSLAAVFSIVTQNSREAFLDDAETAARGKDYKDYKNVAPRASSVTGIDLSQTEGHRVPR